MRDFAGEVPGGIDGHIRIVAVDVHAETGGRVRDTHADGAQADDAELFALDLDAGELLLLFLHALGDVRIVPVGADPVHAFHDIAAGKQHAGKNQLAHAVCVGAGGVEDHDSSFCTLLKRNIVDARTGSGDGIEVVAEIHVVHGGASDQNSVRFFYIFGALKALREMLQTDFGDVV